jgi:hypothetical protein
MIFLMITLFTDASRILSTGTESATTATAVAVPTHKTTKSAGIPTSLGSTPVAAVGKWKQQGIVMVCATNYDDDDIDGGDDDYKRPPPWLVDDPIMSPAKEVVSATRPRDFKETVPVPDPDPVPLRSTTSVRQVTPNSTVMNAGGAVIDGAATEVAVTQTLKSANSSFFRNFKSTKSNKGSSKKEKVKETVTIDHPLATSAQRQQQQPELVATEEIIPG